MKNLLIGMTMALLLFSCASQDPVKETKIEARPPPAASIAPPPSTTAAPVAKAQPPVQSTRVDPPPSPSPAAGECQQPRFTGKAPKEYLSLKNPLSDSSADRQAGERLYGGEVIAGVNCAVCHGRRGNGKGVISKDFSPPPRNFQCSGTVNGIPDGQLFWITRFGSPNTEMPDHPKLSDAQVWQVVLYIRQLAR